MHDAPVEQLRDMAFDVVLYQARPGYEQDRFNLLSAAQRHLPSIYLEHDPPQEHATNTRHWVQDTGTLLVHVTPFNALMWDAGITPTCVVEHGVRLLAEASYTGERREGIVVVNNIDRRGRRLGADVFEQVRQQVPLTLVGMGATRMDGAGEVPNDRLPPVMAEHRFFFNPIRYTSLGLAVIEAMMVGVPVVGLATTELVTVLHNGVNGLIDTRVDRLVDGMRHLLDDHADARRMGELGRRTALERFHIERFVGDWMAVFRQVAG